MIVVLCHKTLEEEYEYEQSDIDDECSIITTQLAYLYQLQGKYTKAASLYNTVLSQKYARVTLIISIWILAVSYLLIEFN